MTINHTDLLVIYFIGDRFLSRIHFQVFSLYLHFFFQNTLTHLKRRSMNSSELFWLNKTRRHTAPSSLACHNIYQTKQALIFSTRYCICLTLLTRLQITRSIIDATLSMQVGYLICRAQVGFYCIKMCLQYYY